MILSVYPAEREAGVTRLMLRGNCDSKTFRTFEINCLQGIKDCEPLYVFRAYCWRIAAPAYKEFCSLENPVNQNCRRTYHLINHPIPKVGVHYHLH